MQCDFELSNGETFSGIVVDELVQYIMNKFAEERLTYEEAEIVLKKSLDLLGVYSTVQKQGDNK